jgi:hypothetical protein
VSTSSTRGAKPKYPDVHVQLSGEDGNANGIIGRVAKALRRSVSNEAASEFTTAAANCGSYDELLVLAMETVTVH